MHQSNEEFTLTTVKLPRMNRKEIDQFLREQFLCRIAFKGSDYPYVAPFQYAYIDGIMHFHFTDYGKKMSLLERDARVCVEIESFTKDLSEYRFVTLTGTLKVIEDFRERFRVIERIARDGKRKLSPKFLAAHGIMPERGWGHLSKRPLLVVKLDEAAKRVGLKSP